MPRDILNEIMTELARELTAPPEIVGRVEAIIRQRWGGERTYILKAPAEGKAQSLGRLLATGASLAEAFDQVGASRRNGYRLLRRRQRW